MKFSVVFQQDLRQTSSWFSKFLNEVFGLNSFLTFLFVPLTSKYYTYLKTIQLYFFNLKDLQ